MPLLLGAAIMDTDRMLPAASSNQPQPPQPHQQLGDSPLYMNNSVVRKKKSERLVPPPVGVPLIDMAAGIANQGYESNR